MVPAPGPRNHEVGRGEELGDPVAERDKNGGHRAAGASSLWTTVSWLALAKPRDAVDLDLSSARASKLRPRPGVEGRGALASAEDHEHLLLLVKAKRFRARLGGHPHDFAPHRKTRVTRHRGADTGDADPERQVQPVGKPSQEAYGEPGHAVGLVQRHGDTPHAARKRGWSRGEAAKSHHAAGRSDLIKAMQNRRAAIWERRNAPCAPGAMRTRARASAQT
jgi:hypothetical protein